MTPLRLLRTALGVAVLAIALVSGVLVAPSQAAAPTKEHWLSDVDHVMSGSQAWLDRRVARGGRHLALNLDIDNTSLETYYDRGRPVPAVLALARAAKARGVSVLFNTARYRGTLVRRAVTMLRAAGYSVDGMCGRYAGEGVVHGKQRCRRHYVAQGYRIIANVGNNRTDFLGGDYERAFRLPNYGGLLS